MRRSIKIFALAIAVIMSAALCLPAAADPFPRYELTEYDQEMLLAFWQQPAYDGMTNGEAVYDIHIAEGGYLSEPAPEYDGSYWTHLLVTPYYCDHDVFSFYLYYDLMGWDGLPIGDDPKSCTKLTPMVTVRPDLYGTLDLHGTSVDQVHGDARTITHLTDFILDDCTYLSDIYLINQPAAQTLSALNCPIVRISTAGSTFKSIRFSSSSYAEPMSVMSIGRGCVSVYYNKASAGKVSRLTAVQDGEMFMGWFRDGELISAEPCVEVDEGGEYTARFGGDMDGDGTVGTADALTAMRMCMGLLPADGVNADVNCSGDIDVADALLILRFAMGLI